jgi:hypothetical protein
MSLEKVENRKRLFRVHFESPVWGEVKIVALNGKPVETKYAKVFILDLSAGGIHIDSRLNLPKSNSLMLEMKFTIMENEFKIKGQIVRRRLNLNNFVMDYGIQFLIDDVNEQTLLVSTIILLSLKLKSGSLDRSYVDWCDPKEIRNFYTPTALRISN